MRQNWKKHQHNRQHHHKSAAGQAANGASGPRAVTGASGSRQAQHHAQQASDGARGPRHAQQAATNGGRGQRNAQKQIQSNAGGPRHAQQDIIQEGVIQHHGKFAFMLSEKKACSDVFLRGKGLDLAMDGDRVQARVRREPNGRFSGEILKVLNHAHTSIVGILKQFPRGWAIFPEKGNTPPAQVLNFASKVTPVAGSFAVLEIKNWPTETSGAAGTVTEILGGPDDIRARITALLRARGISEHFPKEVIAQSSTFPTKLDSSHWQGREELFHLSVVTIDGADAKDFDDAVSLEPLGG